MICSKAAALAMGTAFIAQHPGMQLFITPRHPVRCLYEAHMVTGVVEQGRLYPAALGHAA